VIDALVPDRAVGIVDPVALAGHMKPRPPGLRRTIRYEPAVCAHRHPRARLHRIESGCVSCQRTSSRPSILRIFSDRPAVGPVQSSVSHRCGFARSDIRVVGRSQCRCQAKGGARGEWSGIRNPPFANRNCRRQAACSGLGPLPARRSTLIRTLVAPARHMP
jgi:hypothetical protein